MMVFRVSGSHGIVDGTESRPASKDEEWVKKNEGALPIIWALVSKDLQHLVEGENSGSTAFAALKKKFESSTMARRVELRKALYGAVHDPSKPMDVYIQAVTIAAAQLKAIGHTVEDTEIKDIILMNLHPSYHVIRATLLSQSTEPDLATIKSVLAGSAIAVSHDVGMHIKSESDFDTALAARDGGRGFRGTRGRSGSGQRSSSNFPVDEKGYHWCDTNNDGTCHRCGRPGHIAARCMYDMPQHVKDWAMGWNSGERARLAQDGLDPSVTYASASAHHVVVESLDSPPASPRYPNSRLPHSRSRTPSPDAYDISPLDFVQFT